MKFLIQIHSILLVSLLSLIVQPLSAQNYGEVGTEWYIATLPGYIHYLSEKDTVVNGTATNKIVGYKYDQFNRLEKTLVHYRHQSGDTVYFFMPYSETFEPAIFFNAHVGDTITTYYSGVTAGSMSLTDTTYNSTIHITEIDTVIYDGIPLRRFHFNDLTEESFWAYEFPGNYYLERIGYVGCFAPKLLINPIGNGCIGIRCFKDADLDIQFGEQACDFVTSRPNFVETHAFQTYPNPTTDFFQLESEAAIRRIALVDLQGKVVYEAKQAQQYDISQLPPQLYLIQVYFEDGSIGVEKLVKK